MQRRPGKAEKTAEEQPQQAEKGFPLHGHIVKEVYGENESKLLCIRCGVTVSITDVPTLAGKPCIESERASRKCGCGRAAEAVLPAYDPTTMSFKDFHLCASCAADYLSILKRSGPSLGRMKGRIPANSYWFNLYNTVFQELAGAYPCPACDKFYDSLYMVIKHFGENHLDKAFAKPREIIIDGFEAVATWQYIWCKRCLRFFENEQHFRHHLKLHEARQ
ncbi:MAG: hypothetical protein QXH32_02015 [Candidatus Caldarchaeum sp.]